MSELWETERGYFCHICGGGSYNKEHTCVLLDGIDYNYPICKECLKKAIRLIEQKDELWNAKNARK